MNYYALNDKICFSLEDIDIGDVSLEVVSEGVAKQQEGVIYFLQKGILGSLKRSYCISHSDMLKMKNEDISLIYGVKNIDEYIPNWILDKIARKEVMGININHPRFVDSIDKVRKKGITLHILGLGDVGGTFLTGLRLLADKDIDKIGIYDLDDNRIKRWVMEAGQIFEPFSKKSYPRVEGIRKDELFDCDMFVFCASLGVPKVGNEKKDVRMVQYEGNSRILNIYGKMARESNFKGLFAVVSDPVDMLCKSLYISSNTSDDGEVDYLGLSADQIKGYGLGVMNARASYYAMDDYPYYMEEGRAYGPHGKGLIIANSIYNYSSDVSDYLTIKTVTANLEIRNVGFKPYIAPALSSGALSILATIRGEWHYSTNSINGTFMGSLNRNISSGLEIERLELPEILQERINNTYNYLRDIN